MRRHLAYLKVVLRHKWFVFRACRLLHVPLWIAILHDWRKFLPRQWIPYAHNFFNADGTKRSVRDSTGAYDPNSQSREFREAWLDHQRLRHHWQAWCVIGDNGVLSPLAMPDVFVREMIADWMGAGAAYDNYNPHGWWKANGNKMILHEATWRLINLYFEDRRGMIPTQCPWK